ncbi:MAG: hypothetical protein JW986_05645 [Methanotrichaceae archaeon]|nr:hypothetical protein [Methanotrichaceae archaeon]
MSGEGSSQVVEGVIHLDREMQALRATIYLRIQDVSRIDAPSIVMAENVVRDLEIGGVHGHKIGFSMKFSPLKGRRYTMFVHIDVDGDGEISIGDYITVISYLITPSDSPVHLDLQVSRVGPRR